MGRTFNRTLVEVVEGDITKIEVDAIVNAANSKLRGGGGVDGAIHRAGGPSILDECKKHDGCPTGESIATTAGDLPARYVIHTVGPVWYGGDRAEADMLASCYFSSLARAVDRGCKSVSFPSISTGVYRYPFDDASRVALSSIRDFCARDTSIERILLVAYGAKDAGRYSEILEEFE
ncbi:MAG: O-acetyl-ADP-ribose deacetylase [Deltaproteobacteria bacterium]|nr:O-acetyl-ADP-ribose deacetylase [Deltaproteobacteria bacterium]